MSTPHKTHNAGFLALVHDAKTRVKQMTVDDYKRNASADHILVDVREDSEWNAGHASGAVHLGRGIIERDIESQIPDKEKTLVLYCGGGFRSALAADNLQKMGYTNVSSMDGGWRGWTEKGYPTER